MGDLVNTTGAVQAIRNRYPNARIVLEGGPTAPFLFPNVEVWVRKRHGGILGKLQRIRKYKAERFDLAIVLTHSHLMARLARAAKIPVVIGGAREPNNLFTRSVIFNPKGHDLFDTLEGVLKLLEIEGSVAPVIPLQPSDIQKAESLIPKDSLGVHIGASAIEKQWPEQRWKEFLSQLPEPAYIFSGPGEHELAEKLVEGTHHLAIGRNLSLLETAACFQRVRTLVVADSGPAHLAAAVGCSTVVLYGPTNPNRYHPWGEKSVAIREMEGCSHYEYGCIHKTNGVCSRKCMLAIEPKHVLEKLDNP